jgi:hypothetical protein
MDFGNAGRPVRGYLLTNGHVQTHMEEGILPAALWREFGAEGCIAGFEPRHVFRVLGNDRGELCL